MQKVLSSAPQTGQSIHSDVDRYARLDINGAGSELGWMDGAHILPAFRAAAHVLQSLLIVLESVFTTGQSSVGKGLT